MILLQAMLGSTKQSNEIGLVRVDWSVPKTLHSSSPNLCTSSTQPKSFSADYSSGPISYPTISRNLFSRPENVPRNPVGKANEVSNPHRSYSFPIIGSNGNLKPVRKATMVNSRMVEATRASNRQVNRLISPNLMWPAGREVPEPDESARQPNRSEDNRLAKEPNDFRIPKALNRLDKTNSWKSGSNDLNAWPFYLTRQIDSAAFPLGASRQMEVNKGKRKYESDCSFESCLSNVKRKYEPIVISSDLQNDATCSRLFTASELQSDLKSEVKNSFSNCRASSFFDRSDHLNDERIDKKVDKKIDCSAASSTSDFKSNDGLNRQLNAELNGPLCGQRPGPNKNNDLHNLMNLKLSFNKTACKPKSTRVISVGVEDGLNGVERGLNGVSSCKDDKSYAGFVDVSAEQNHLNSTNRKPDNQRKSTPSGQRASRATDEDQTKNRTENASPNPAKKSTDLAAPVIVPNDFSDLNFNLSNYLAQLNRQLDGPFRIKLNEFDANRFAANSIDRPNKLDKSNCRKSRLVGENQANDSELVKLNRNKLGENVDRPTPVTEVTLELDDDYLLRTPVESSPVALNATTSGASHFANCTLNALDDSDCSSNPDEASVLHNSLNNVRCSIREEFMRLNSIVDQSTAGSVTQQSHSWNHFTHLSEIYFEKLHEQHFKMPYVNTDCVASFRSNCLECRLDEHFTVDRAAELQAKNLRDDASAMKRFKPGGSTSSVYQTNDDRECAWLNRSSSTGSILENNQKNNFKNNLNLLLEGILKTSDQRKSETPFASPKSAELFTNDEKERSRINVKTGRAKKAECKQGGYQCSECRKVFRRNSTLSTHKLIHTNTRPFRCPYCNKGELYTANSRPATDWRCHLL